MLNHKITPMSINISICSGFEFYKTSIGDLTSLNITFLSPDDGSLEPKHYNVDFLLDYFVFQFFSILPD